MVRFDILHLCSMPFLNAEGKNTSVKDTYSASGKYSQRFSCSTFLHITALFQNGLNHCVKDPKF